MERHAMNSLTQSLTGVGAIISAAHKSSDGIVHGHTWEIVAWFDGEPDAVQKQRELEAYLKIFDHSILRDDVASGEALGRAIIYGLGCVKVDVNRPLERIYAKVSK
jgi:hypothetical protein